jgi:hypothetical protein
MMWRSALVSSVLILVFSVVVIASTGNLEYVGSRPTVVRRRTPRSRLPRGASRWPSIGTATAGSCT